MFDNTIIEKFATDLQAPLSLFTLSINLVVGIVLSLVLKIHYEKFSSTLANKKQFSIVLPFIVVVTILIITVVKTSLALSLGLVGALSIVRFRTPIKDPEDLAYLFLSIALGLGLGANQTFPTILSTFIILIFVALLKYKFFQNQVRNYYLHINFEKDFSGSFDTLNQVMKDHSAQIDLKRLDTKSGKTNTLYQLTLESPETLKSLVEKLSEEIEGVEVTFTDYNGIPFV